MAFSKPAQWAWTALGCARPDLAAGLGLWLPSWEGTGSPKEYISNTLLTRPASVVWATQEGMAVLRFAGTDDGLHLPAPIINQSTAWTVMVVVRIPGAMAEMALYNEVAAGGSDEAYTEPFYLSSDFGGYRDVASDTYALVTDPQELFAGATEPARDFTVFKAVVSRRSGNTLTMLVGGVVCVLDYQGLQDNIVVPPMAFGLIGIGCTDGATFVQAPLIGDMAALAVWPTIAKSDQAIADIGANPFVFAAQAPVPSGIGGRPRLAVLNG